MTPSQPNTSTESDTYGLPRPKTTLSQSTQEFSRLAKLPATGSVESEELNKYAKYYFTECQVNGKTDWSLVDGSSDFSVIPTNSKGIVQMTVGDLRTIISDVVDTAARKARIDELKRKMTLHIELLSSKDFKAGFNEALDQIDAANAIRIAQLEDTLNSEDNHGDSK